MPTLAVKPKKASSAKVGKLSKPSEIFRSYAFKVAPETNSGKINTLEELHAEWYRTLGVAFDWYWSPFLQGGLLPKNPVRSGPESTFPATGLVTSQKDLMAVAIEGQAQGWASNLKNRIARSVMRCKVLEMNLSLRRELLWINSMRAWLLPYRDQVALIATGSSKEGSLQSLSAEASRMMRKLVRRYVEIYRLPNPLNIPLQFNQLSAKLEEPNAKSKKGEIKPVNNSPVWANRWLSVSTLVRGQRVVLPVMDNPYARSKKGVEKKTYSLHKRAVDKRGSAGQSQWYVSISKAIGANTWNKHDVEVLGIDVGLRTLLSTSEGDLRGERFIDQLITYDSQLLKIQKGLQEAGIKRLSGCRRYRVLVNRIDGYIKTSVQTALKSVLELHRPKLVVVEELAFAGKKGELSKRMNRLLRKFGQGYFKKTLEEKSQEYGFTVEYVNPAYSSQTCAACGFVHKDNRKSDTFTCLCCGHKAHADVNAAKNLTRRSSQGQHESVGIGQLYGKENVWAQSLKVWIGKCKKDLQQLTPSVKTVSGTERRKGLNGKKLKASPPVWAFRAVGRTTRGLVALQKVGQDALPVSELRRIRRLQTPKDLLNGLEELERLLTR